MKYKSFLNELQKVPKDRTANQERIADKTSGEPRHYFNLSCDIAELFRQAFIDGAFDAPELADLRARIDLTRGDLAIVENVLHELERAGYDCWGKALGGNAIQHLADSLEKYRRCKNGKFTLDLVTLAQAAEFVKRKKRALEKYKSRGDGLRLPPPDFPARRRGQADQWKWATIRPFLSQFRADLPETFPGNVR